MAPMRAAYEGKLWACSEEGYFLGYFLRVQPAIGAKFFSAAMARRERNGCQYFFLGRLGLRGTPELNGCLSAYGNGDGEAPSRRLPDKVDRRGGTIEVANGGVEKAEMRGGWRLAG